ncbi:hypothetical protein RJ55_04870 [Drechmeria coniospora]|nr:hypothetical protein RJ55_04870 [Drechmeria coniospora]
MHKSNSTYFTDLDVARIKLLGRIIAPAWPMNNMRIEYKGRDGIARRERVRGRAALVLGATYTSFKREMAAFASYDVESRILGWDSRWLFVGSWFVSRKGKPRQISASSLSKYIIKKGRITVKPEQFLSESGWITSRRDEIGSADAQMASGSWTWQEIEEQRVKGMAVVDTWGAADLRLEKMYSDEKAQ